MTKKDLEFNKCKQIVELYQDRHLTPSESVIAKAVFTYCKGGLVKLHELFRDVKNEPKSEVNVQPETSHEKKMLFVMQKRILAL
jgi:hypothetical protein